MHRLAFRNRITARLSARLVLAGALALLAPLFLGGCGSLFKQPNPNKATFLLPAMGPVNRTATDGNVSGSSAGSRTVVAVRSFRIVHEYSDKSLTYRLADVRMERDYYNAWLVSPDAMVTERMREWLAASGLVDQVQDSGSLVTATHILEGSILELGGDYRGPEATAVVSIRITLLPSARAASGGALVHNTYRAEVPLADREPATLVAGLGQALAQVYEEFGAEAAKHLP